MRRQGQEMDPGHHTLSCLFEKSARNPRGGGGGGETRTLERDPEDKMETQGRDSGQNSDPGLISASQSESVK